MDKSRKGSNSFSNRPRRPANLAGALSHRLDAYALAAAAAGVGVLACSLPSEATIICKDASVTLSGTQTFPLNPANQQIAPFNIVQTTQYFYNFSSSLGFWNRGFFLPNPQGVMLSVANDLPAALSAGALIGPSANFAQGNSYGLLFTYGPGSLYSSKGGGTVKKHRGNFRFGETNYVGFRFLVSGQYSYGWARIDVTFQNSQTSPKVVETRMKIPVYGYESTPNTAIVAGSCSGAAASNGGVTPNITPTDDLPEASSGALPLSARGASLGLLALGDRSLSTWRRNGNKSSEAAGDFAPAQGSNAKSN
ncbi:MAG TPA: hypothetical protein VNY51_10350 [Candidatus Dormibacteraeota bacterium]|jgi:hypothetical protein|nr:hypothetical protein [Candidatus Dormibacteraeota bacterium]